MAPLNLIFQLLVDGVWTTYPAYTEDGWRTRIGPDADTGLTANRLEVELANPDLSMDPSNAASPLYGKIGRNTPARIRIDGTTVTWGEASSWRPDRNEAHVGSITRGRSSVSLVAEGLLRRLGKWDDPLDSPLARQINSYGSLTGYWRLEDAAGASSLANDVRGGLPGNYAGTITLGADGAGGAASSLELGSDGYIAGQFQPSTLSGWQLVFSIKLDAIPPSATYIAMFQWSDTEGRTWYWRVNNTGYQVEVDDTTGAAISTTTVGWGSVDITSWIRYRMKVTVSGGTVTYEPAWYQQDSPFVTGTTATFTSTATGQPFVWQSVANVYTDGARYGHVFAVTDTALDLVTSSALTNAFNGYLGERAGDRFARITGQLGLTRYVSGSIATTAPMGRQKAARLVDLLEEIAATEGGLIYDEPLDIALMFRTAASQMNAVTSLALTYGVDVSAPFQKIIDDVGVQNDITVTNADGTELRVERTTGSLSTAAPPAGVGRYKLPLATNLAYPSRQLADRAYWELALGTLDRPRYQSLTVDLTRFPAYRPAIAAMRPGDRITLAGIEPDVVPLRVISIERSGGAVTEKAVLNCLPGDVWETGVYDGTTRLYDSRTSTLAAGITSSATTFTVTFTAPQDAWSTTSAYDVLVAGERIGIPIGGMSAPAGSHPGPWTQTATGVTRAKNGVVKAQASGAAVNVFNPARYSLGGI